MYLTSHRAPHYALLIFIDLSKDFLLFSFQVLLTVLLMTESLSMLDSHGLVLLELVLLYILSLSFLCARHFALGVVYPVR